MPRDEEMGDHFRENCVHFRLIPPTATVLVEHRLVDRLGCSSQTDQSLHHHPAIRCHRAIQRDPAASRRHPTINGPVLGCHTPSKAVHTAGCASSFCYELFPYDFVVPRCALLSADSQVWRGNLDGTGSVGDYRPRHFRFRL